MKPEDVQRDRKAMEIVDRALEMADIKARAAYLEGVCGCDSGLKTRVTALLASHVADNFLEGPAAGPAPDALAIVSLTEKPGDMIGRYKLLEKIGEGGMGVVYMAEQEEPVRRRVALKVIKLGMDTRQVVARFEAERQALAMMDHPNIARVLDGGATDTGRPFFVMELVPGVPITEFCNQNQLSAQERLKLFINVCQAIQSAHQKAIIHRDLKPSNVLVTLNGGLPHPMVIDFGVAKATNQKLTEKTLFTNFATMIGTPAYMSPEQAEMSRLDVDTRSDIYSLGVLLYELLTATTPFSEKRLRSVAYREMQRIIVEEEPERPSTRLRKTCAVNSSARWGSKSEIDPDLDWIVMKCLEKDRNRRYGTANGLAADIQRHLSNEPVVARPASAAYRFQKMVRRNKVAFAAVAAVTMALVVGLAVSFWLFVRESKARERAIAAEQEQLQLRQQAETSERNAKAEASKSDQVAGFLTELFESFALSSNLDKAEKTVTDVLLASSDKWPYYGRILKVRAGLRAQQGKWSEAAKDLSQAVELEPTNHWHYHLLAPLLVQNGDLAGYHKHRQSTLKVFGGTDDPVVAERMARDYLILPLSGPDLETVNRWVNLAVAGGTEHWAWIWFQYVKALAEYRQGHFDGALEWGQKVLAKVEHAPELVVQAYLVVAMAHYQLNHRDDARAALAKGVEIAETKLPKLQSGAIGTDVTNWGDWILAQLLMIEAKDLIEGPSKPAKEPEKQGESPKEATP